MAWWSGGTVYPHPWQTHSRATLEFAHRADPPPNRRGMLPTPKAIALCNAAKILPLLAAPLAPGPRGGAVNGGSESGVSAN